MAKERLRVALLLAALAGCNGMPTSSGESVTPLAAASTAERSGPPVDSLAPDGPAASSAVAAPHNECDNDWDVCRGPGGEGRCFAHLCAPVGPGCFHDVDCYDGNDCTIDQCSEGKCVAEAREGACVFEERTDGECRQGWCEATMAVRCNVDDECPTPANPCMAAACTAQVCQTAALDEGAECETAARTPGTCADGVCVVDRDRAAGEKKCRRVRTPWGPRERCRRTTRHVLPDVELVEAALKIRDSIAESVRYDMHIGLVELPDGGYNIVAVNARTRDDVRGLVDPSFVAFNVAGLTAKTKWRSRNLLVWLAPYAEGWTIPTAGSRTAIRKGQAASGLGFLGVVDVKAYRSWLEKSFRRLPAIGSALVGRSTKS